MLLRPSGKSERPQRRNLNPFIDSMVAFMQIHLVAETSGKCVRNVSLTCLLVGNGRNVTSFLLITLTCALQGLWIYKTYAFYPFSHASISANMRRSLLFLQIFGILVVTNTCYAAYNPSSDFCFVTGIILPHSSMKHSWGDVRKSSSLIYIFQKYLYICSQSHQIIR